MGSGHVAAFLRGHPGPLASAADVDPGDLVELGQLGQPAVEVGALHVGGDDEAVTGVAGRDRTDVDLADRLKFLSARVRWKRFCRSRRTPHGCGSVRESFRDLPKVAGN